MARSGASGSTGWKICSTGWINDQTRCRALGRDRTGNAASAGKGVARALAAAPDRGVVDEERFHSHRRPPLQSARRLGRGRGPGSGHRAEQTAVLHVGRARPRERGDLDAHRDEQRDASAHGAIGLPARSAAGLSGRYIRLAAVPWHAGAGIGTDGLEHDPEKWVPVFGKDHAPANPSPQLKRRPEQLNLSVTWSSGNEAEGDAANQLSFSADRRENQGAGRLADRKSTRRNP